MDPISLGFGIAGFGMKLLGGIMGSNDASAAHNAQMQEFQTEGKMNEQKQTAMVLASRRQQMDIIRNSQRARSMALSAATNQGAQFGTGLQGGYGQISGQTNNNLLTNSQSLQAGNDQFNLTNQMTGYNLQYSNALSDLNQDQGLMSLGGSLMSAGPTLGKMFGGGSEFKGFGNIFGGSGTGFVSGF